MTAPVRNQGPARRGPTDLGPRNNIALRVPGPVYDEIRERALLEGKSLTRYVADIMAAVVGLPDYSQTSVYERARKEREAKLPKGA